MYTTPSFHHGTIKRNTSTEGETIEQKIRRIMDNEEPITDGAPLIYTERKHGVLPDYNIRTDRFDFALDVKAAQEKANAARRELRRGEMTYDTMSDADKAAFNTKFPDNKFAKQINQGGENK